MGARATLAIHYGTILALAFVAWLFRKPLLAIQFGTRPALMLAALIVLALAVLLGMRLSKQLPIKAFAGLPELASERYDSRLVTAGIYARMRHPRYVQIVLALLAYALFCDYLAAYVVFALSLLWAVLVVRVEEGELRARFGAAHAQYCQRIPPFVPRFWRHTDREDKLA